MPEGELFRKQLDDGNGPDKDDLLGLSPMYQEGPT